MVAEYLTIPVLTCSEYEFNILAALKEEKIILSNKKTRRLRSELKQTIMNTKEIIKSFDNFFIEKRTERIKVLGEEQNNDIEKRIFLQIMDFLWRSHLQYLEQLRQVIGLRSYGQKDPLAEFRREAFQLFEDLLFKIKIETIKFLINTNIVIQDKKDEKQTSDFVKKRKISRNEPCSCGSGKKYKHCHGKVA